MGVLAINAQSGPIVAPGSEHDSNYFVLAWAGERSLSGVGLSRFEVNDLDYTIERLDELIETLMGAFPERDPFGLELCEFWFTERAALLYAEEHPEIEYFRDVNAYGCRRWRDARRFLIAMTVAIREARAAYVPNVQQEPVSESLVIGSGEILQQENAGSE